MPFGSEKYFPWPRKLLFNSQVNINASASLSGGPAKKAEKRSQNEEETPKKYFSDII